MEPTIPLPHPEDEEEVPQPTERAEMTLQLAGKVPEYQEMVVTMKPKQPTAPSEPTTTVSTATESTTTWTTTTTSLQMALERGEPVTLPEVTKVVSVQGRSIW